jgi:HEAT repeat protein
LFAWLALKTTPPAENLWTRFSPRTNVVDLVSALAESQHVEKLLQIADDESETWETRRHALIGLDRLQCAAPSQTIALVRAWFEHPLGNQTPNQPCAWDLISLLSLKHLRPDPEAIRKELDDTTPEVRLDLLRFLLTHDRYERHGPELNPPLWLEDHLLRCWNAGDHLADKDGYLNIDIASGSWERPETRARFAEWVARDAKMADGASLVGSVLGNLSPDECSEAVAAHPSWRAAQLASLDLSLRDLLEHVGEARLLKRLELVVRQENVSVRSNRVVEQPLELGRVRELLTRWAPARPTLHRLLCSYELLPDIRGDLLLALFDADREQAVRWAMAALRFPDNDVPLSLLLTRRLLNSPKPSDRPLLRKVLGLHLSSAVRYRVLDALDRLGEDDPTWADVLLDLTHHPEPRMALRAHAALARLGHADALQVLGDAARPDRPWQQRFEALLALSRLDPSGHVELLAETVVRERPDRATTRKEQAQSAELRRIAAKGLMHAGSPRALDVLFRAHYYRHVIRVVVPEQPEGPTDWFDYPNSSNNELDGWPSEAGK